MFSYKYDHYRKTIKTTNFIKVFYHLVKVGNKIEYLTQLNLIIIPNSIL